MGNLIDFVNGINPEFKSQEKTKPCILCGGKVDKIIDSNILYSYGRKIFDFRCKKCGFVMSYDVQQIIDDLQNKEIDYFHNNLMECIEAILKRKNKYLYEWRKNNE